MKNKATHEGHCQACGSLQKLPGGLLSKHGYTVEWSCFIGTCPGSGHLPFEQDSSLVQVFVRSAQSSLDRVLDYITELNAPAQEARGWVREYHTKGEGWGRTGKYVWVNRELFEATRHENGYTCNEIHHFNNEGKLQRDCRYNEETALDVATEMNHDYAVRHEAPEAKQLQQYIAWQQERVTNWKPMPLRAVDAEPVIADPTVLTTDDGQYVETFVKASGRYGSRQRPAYSLTAESTKAKVFTKRSATLAQGILGLFRVRTTRTEMHQ